MPETIHLSIDNPCSENWDQMSPEQQGRFCASCNKTVVNFAQMTDQDVLTWLARNQGPTCGRFRQDQLQRPLIATQQLALALGRTIVTDNTAQFSVIDGLLCENWLRDA